MIRYGVTVLVVVNAQEPIGALDDLEAAVERVPRAAPAGVAIRPRRGPARRHGSRRRDHRAGRAALVPLDALLDHVQSLTKGNPPCPLP